MSVNSETNGVMAPIPETVASSVDAVGSGAKVAAVQSVSTNGGAIAATLTLCAFFAGLSIAGILMWITARFRNQHPENHEIDAKGKASAARIDLTDENIDSQSECGEVFPRSPKDFADCDDSYLRFAQIVKSRSYWYI